MSAILEPTVQENCSQLQSILDEPEQDLRFVAAVPLRSSHRMELGLLVIADREPRPGLDLHPAQGRGR
jgi:hypothetical protein